MQFPTDYERRGYDLIKKQKNAQNSVAGLQKTRGRLSGIFPPRRSPLALDWQNSNRDKKRSEEMRLPLQDDDLRIHILEPIFQDHFCGQNSFSTMARFEKQRKWGAITRVLFYILFCVVLGLTLCQQSEMLLMIVNSHLL